jgi:predicted dehydrogenase
VPGFTDVDTLLATVHPDVVHVTLPHYLHAPVAAAALRAGCHVLTEKPVGESYRAGAELAGVAAASGRTLGVCFQNRYNDSSIALRKVVDDLPYGRVLSGRASVWWHRAAPYYASSPWRKTWSEAGGGVLINQTIHTIDLLCWFLGAPESVSGVASNLTHGSIAEVEDTATIVMRHPNGVGSVYFATNSHAVDAPVELELDFEHATVTLKDGVVTATTTDGATEVLATDAKAVGDRAYWGTSHARLINDFHARVTAGEPFWIDADAALVSLGVLRDVYVASGLVAADER